MPQPITLEASSPDGRARTVPIPPGRAVTVGRTGEADVVFPDDRMLSRAHFGIEPDGEACRLRDLGSRNGTFLNGRRADAPARLRDGDRIRAGQTEFRVRIGAPSPPPASMEPVAPPPPPPPIAPAAPGPAPAPVAVPPRPAGKGAGMSTAAAPAPAPIPFASGTMVWTDPQGAAWLVVIVKSTFAIPDDGRSAPRAVEPIPLFGGDVPDEEDPEGPVRFETDMVPFKPKADVVLVGKCHRPKRKPPGGPVDAVLKVGALERKIRVFGDRAWWFPTALALIPDMSEPAPFEAMDLTYSRAFGGIDGPAALYCAENLAGTGFIGKKGRESIHGKALPNLEDPADPITSWESRPRPVGFGFYGRGWMPRLKLAGTPSEDPGPAERASGLPPDFDPAFFNGAHPDLQVEGHLRGDEPVELQHLSPDGFLEFRLPGVKPRATVVRWAVPPLEWLEARLAQGEAASLDDVPTVEERVRLALDTLVLIPEERRFYLVHRGRVRLSDPEALLVARVAIELERPAPPPAKGARAT